MCVAGGATREELEPRPEQRTSWLRRSLQDADTIDVHRGPTVSPDPAAPIRVTS